MAVVVIDEHGQRPFEMLRVHDQHPIKTFGSDRSDEPFRDPVGLRSLNWRANDSGASKNSIRASELMPCRSQRTVWPTGQPRRCSS